MSVANVRLTVSLQLTAKYLPQYQKSGHTTSLCYSTQLITYYLTLILLSPLRLHRLRPQTFLREMTIYTSAQKWPNSTLTIDFTDMPEPPSSLRFPQLASPTAT
jgi:hypothetical protein